MKKTIIGLISLMLVVSCKKDAETTPPGQVTDIEYQSNYGSIEFSWKKPADADYYYTDIVYQTKSGEWRSKKASFYRDSTTIEGLPDTSMVQFNFYAVDKDGNRSLPVSFAAKAKLPAYEAASKTFEVKPSFGGAKVYWKNPTGKKVFINVLYKNEEDERVQVSKTSVLEDDFIVLTGMKGDVEQTVSVTAGDGISNVTEALLFNVTPWFEKELDKSKWKIVDFSSEESSGEGSNGFAQRLIDGDDATFWHSQWAGSTATLPHHITVDLGMISTISKLKIFRRPGNTDGKTIEYYGSVDNVSFELIGNVLFESSPGGGSKELVLDDAVEARYVKIVVPDSYRTPYVSLAELYVRGAQ